MKTEKVILALAGAATAGVILGMLIAPEKGFDLRKRLANRSGNLASDLGDLINEGVTQFQKLKVEASNQIAGLEVGKKNRPTTTMI